MGFASYEERLINLARTYLAILKNMPFHPQGQPYQPYEKPNAGGELRPKRLAFWPSAPVLC